MWIGKKLTWFFGLALLAVAGAVRAQEELGDEFEEEFALLEEEQVYSAAKHVQHISDSPSAITVITGEQVRDSHCTTMACILRMVPEVEVRRVLPMFHAVGARALAGELADKALVLVDGREINNELFGIVFWAGLPVSLEEIERIEVIRGPGSALYGANAHSMVVSITSRQPERSRAQFFTGLGEHGRTVLFGRADGVWDTWRLSLAATHEQADSWRQAGLDEGNLVTTRLRLQHDCGAGCRSRFDAGLTSADLRIYTGLLPAWWRDLYFGHAMIDHAQGPFQGRVSFNLLRGIIVPELELTYQGMQLGTLPDFTYLNTSLDAEVQFNWSFFSGNLLVVGANYRWIAMYADNNDPATEHQHRVGVFLQDEQELFGKLLLTAGLRFDYNSITPFTVSPRGALVYRLADNQRLRLAAGQAFRKPSFMNTSFHFTGITPDPAFPEIVEFFRDNIGNRELGNESITSIELGYRGSFLEGRLEVESDVFFNMYRDTIVFVSDIATSSMGLPDLTASMMRFENQGRDVDTIGGTVALVARPVDGLRLFGNYTYRYSRYVSTVESQAVEGLAGEGDRVPWEPAHLANLGGSWRLENGLGLGLALRYSSARRNTQHRDGEIFNPVVFLRNPAQLVVSGWLSWNFEVAGLSLEAGLKALNLFNRSFRDTVAVTTTAGTEVGGELIGRRVVLFLRGRL